jgi:tRNA-specific 2-thiouridylase
VGQRRGLPARGGQEPLFVLGVDPTTNTVTVGRDDELLSHVLWAEDVSFISGEAPAGPLAVETKIRYRSEPAPALLTVAEGRAQVRFQRPQRAITPGQAVVFYQGSRVLGGGIIAANGRNWT